MSGKPLQVSLPNGDQIWARVAVEGPSDVSSSPLKRLQLDDLGQTIQSVADTVREAAKDLVPDELEVEFGLELTLKAGKLTSMLAEASGSASMRVKLIWKGPTADSPAAIVSTDADNVGC